VRWLLGTCALFEYAKKAPAPEVIAWLDEQDEASLSVSVISLGEIEKYILKPRASGWHRITAWLGKVEQRFAGRCLPLDAAALHVWAQIAAHSELAGQPLPVMDGLLIATAQCHGFTVVTPNVRDFAPYP
jgi:predicted nucleic acid-binding protein